MTGITASMYVHRRTLGKKHVERELGGGRYGQVPSRPTPWPPAPGPRIVREGVVPQDDTH